MKQLETSDWMVLNSIIYEIYTTADLTVMRENLLKQLKIVLDFDGADFFLSGQDKQISLIDPVTYNCDSEQTARLEELDYSRGIMFTGKSIVYRETDIISDEKRVKTEYYKRVYLPTKWHYSLQFILGKDTEFLGVITFYRMIGKDDFSYHDIFLLGMLKDHLSYRLWSSAKDTKAGSGKITVAQAAQKYELTNREETVLRLLMEGKDDKNICEELIISVNTCKKHVLNIYRKLNIKNRVQMFKMIREKV